MIQVNPAVPYESAAVTFNAPYFPNIFVGITNIAEGAKVELARLCEDSVYRVYRETSWTSEGARLLSLPAGSYKLRITGGNVVAEVKQL